tara:strand:+ start:356 stop:841 length:486 start_codon:yes stop_codon:yes gene_type:complete
MVEIWKDVKGHEGDYQVSNLGNVKSFKGVTERILKNGTNPKGYVIVNLANEGSRVSVTMHRLVMNTFHYESELHINHINSNIKDNSLSNLEYVTHVENMNHRYTENKTKRYGARWDKDRSKWRVYITVNSKIKFLGRFDDEEFAYQVFYNAYIKAHGVKPW